MVICFEWHRTAVDQTSSSGLPMTGEDTGLGALASPLVGYLGKVQQRAASLENCPWCTSKGLIYVLRSFRINLQESITLCTNPQCLFPLVSRSLEDVLASLAPVEPTVGEKRKHPFTLEKEELVRPENKRLRSSELDSFGTQCSTETLISQVEHGAVKIVSSGQHAAPKTDGGKLNGCRNSPVTETTGWESLQKDCYLDQEPENTASRDTVVSPTCMTTAGHPQCSAEDLLTSDGDEPELSPHHGALGTSEAKDDFKQLKNSSEVLNRHCCLDSNQSFFTNGDIYSIEMNVPSPQHNEQATRTEQKSLSADITACKETGGFKTPTEGLSTTTITESEKLVSVPNRLFWSNSNNLCWLDSLLVALVNCKSLRKCKHKDGPQRSFVLQLMTGYEDTCAAIQMHQKTGRDGVVRVPDQVLQKADGALQSLRMSVFKLLQPKLHCKLGQRETPVFALPLLLQMDSWVEPLFQSTFYWEFQCSECKTLTKERVTNTLPTFTNVLPDWGPLNAVHLAPCNVCGQKNQRRTMMLESVPPVFELHFVEGLPNNDVRIYAFTFKGKRYSITTVIQYNHQLKHFVTWICNSDGSWLEYDDLKHPNCKTHQRFPVPAQEMHIIFWEVEEDKEEPCACSPSSTFPESPPSKNAMNSGQGDKDLTAEELAPDQSLLMSFDDTADIVCALTASENSSNDIDTTVTAGVDTSIGSTTLLDAFEGLSHNDIITLTLVEIKEEKEMQPFNDNEQMDDVSVPSRNETLDSTPDSSSAAVGSEMSQGPDVELPTTSTSDSANGSSSDPTFVPGGKRGRGRGRGRGKTVSRQTVKKAAVPKVAPNISTESSELSEVISSKLKTTAAAAAGQKDTLPVEPRQQASPVSSTEASSLSASQMSHPVPPQNARWSFLLSKHPLNHVHKSIAKLTPNTLATQVKSTPPAHSTPNPVRRPQTCDRFFPKPQLRTEESEGLPPKAAEMYGGFGAKSSNASSPVPSPALLNGKSKPFLPITCNQHKSLKNTTVVSGAPIPMPGGKLHEISSSKKASSQSSKLPAGLSDTEALRYKLIKKLKAKKKKLAKLNEMLGHQGSPNTVTSSTYDGSTCDDFLSDLLSPATTASHLSPDSSGFLEMLANGQDGVDQLDCGVNAVAAVSQMNAPNDENFLDEFLSQAEAERPTEMEAEALHALELFI
ncbi:SUMO-specific isopeptidase USPL1 [Etheostoma cragini]|uniref:SUMO-specific isopeptidase USPL1 n=1 Tax=Etheostoma cragini TaxID=417921 RepID=UPI00155F0FCA|nr:SUMO-specific isopeptidase USPL1 [Etheostoma cragini]